MYHRVDWKLFISTHFLKYLNYVGQPIAGSNPTKN